MANDDDRVYAWEMGLPTVDDLTPLTQPLIPPELASAFSITPENQRTMLEVNRASQNTLSGLRGGQLQTPSFNNHIKSFAEGRDDDNNNNNLSVEIDEEPDPSDSRKIRRTDDDLNSQADNCYDESSARSAAAVKRPRLVWTPQLHKRFVDVVAHLGIKNAVPKTIMQLMNVEGLTRENVASHLQKYRLYLKRMQGLSSEGPSPSDHLFASTPVPQSLQEPAGSGHMPVPMNYPPQMMQMPVYGHPGAGGSYHGFESHPYNNYGSSYHGVTHNNK
ncbi:hypothetical protein RJ640_015354 [Escallonia rubra]|uniref:HTH myb-type domain-containing protein n=1 Tax=Escallonia rubra TaxID=112253 RepID=A0AA88UWB4_9ASTE|nr:hypothetical protein RJ640_015354 [Escallonia rubra]